MADNTYIDQELERVTSDPSYSVADVRAAESWAINAKAAWEGEAKTQAQRRKEVLAEKGTRLYEQVRNVQKAIDNDHAALREGRLTVPEFMQQRRRHLAQIDQFERVLTGLAANQQVAEDMLGDPVGWMDAFYSKWTSLAHRRPRVDDWINERRARR